MHAEKIGVPFWLNHRGAPFFVAARMTRMTRMRLGFLSLAVRQRSSVRMGLWGMARMTRIFLKKYIHTITCHPPIPHRWPPSTVPRTLKNFFGICRVSEPTASIPCPARNPGELQENSIRVIRVIPRRTFQNPLFHPPHTTPPARIFPRSSPTSTDYLPDCPTLDRLRHRHALTLTGRLADTMGATSAKQLWGRVCFMQ